MVAIKNPKPSAIDDGPMTSATPTMPKALSIGIA
jgi:hypothetical protein